jgi:hypothetical protein
MIVKDAEAWKGHEHSIEFEHFVRDSGRFPDAIGSESSPGSAIDIEPKYDLAFSLHNSVKVTKGSTVGLADAIRFYENDRPFRFIIGIWKQFDEETKLIVEIREIVVTLRTLRRLKGSISLADIKAIHKQYASYPAGLAGQMAAQRYADSVKKSFSSKLGLVDLAFKGDKGAQRRLQLSIRLSTLTNAANDDPIYTHLGEVTKTVIRERADYHGQALPLEMKSRPRTFPGAIASPQAPISYAPVINVPTAQMVKDAESKRQDTLRVDDQARTASLLKIVSPQPALI